MIIDADTHISPQKENGTTITYNRLIELMDKNGIDKSLTWLQPLYMRSVDDGNGYVYEATKKYPKRFLGFGWADPHFGLEKAKNQIKQSVYEYGLYGVKLNGAQNSFSIDDANMSLPLIEEIAKTGKMLAFHVGVDSYNNTHPFKVAKIAKMYPELTILLAHMGGAGSPDLSEFVIEIASEYKNLHLIGSQISSLSIMNAIKALGPDRVSFGSDVPFAYPHVELAMYNALLEEEVSKEGKELIMGKNIERIFRLK